MAVLAPWSQLETEGYGNFRRENYNITGVWGPRVRRGGKAGRGGNGNVYILRDLIKYFNGPTKDSLISHKA